MDVPRNLPKMNTNLKNSTKFSYDGGHIQKIPRRRTTTRAPIQTHHLPHNFHKTFEASLGGFGNSRETDLSKVFNSNEYFNERLRRLLNGSHWTTDDISWLYPPPPTRDFTSLFNENHNKVVFEVPVKQKYVPTTTIFVVITSILFLVFCVLRVILYAQRAPSEERSIRRQITEERNLSNISPANPQEHSNDNGSFSLLVNSEHSPQSGRYSDSPPTYFECAARNDGVINKSFDANSEEPPPPYSMCIETLKNTNEVPQVHKRQSGEQPESITATDVHLSNVVDTDVTLSKANETTIDISDGNNGL